MRHKPLAGQVFTDLVDSCWFDVPFEGFRGTFRGRWNSHVGDLYYVNDWNVVKKLLKCQTCFEGRNCRFADVVHTWTGRDGAHRRIIGRSDGAQIKKNVTLQLPHSILNLVVKTGFKEVATVYPAKPKARKLRGWMGLSKQVASDDEALLPSEDVQIEGPF